MRTIPPVVAAQACLAALVLDAAADVLPDPAVLGLLTPQRVVLLAGLVALLAGGARPATFRTRLDIPVALLVASVALSTALGGWPGAPLRGLLTMVAAYYLVIGLLRLRPDAWRTLALLAAVAIGITGAVALGQLSAGTPTGFCRGAWLTAAACEPGTAVRAVGTFANPNLLAAVVVLLGPLAVLAAVPARSGPAGADRAVRGIGPRPDLEHALVPMALAAVGYLGLLASMSRAGYLAAVVGLVVLAAARWRPSVVRRRPRLLAAAGAGVLVLAALLVAAVPGLGTLVGVRRDIWATAVDVAGDHPLGVGLGRAGAVLDARLPGPEDYAHAHNLWLNWWVEAGPPGLLGIVAVTAVALGTAAAGAWRGSDVLRAALAGQLGFLLMSLVDHPANLSRVALLWWLVLGVAMAAAPHPVRRRRDARRDTSRSGRRIGTLAAERPAAAH